MDGFQIATCLRCTQRQKLSLSCRLAALKHSIKFLNNEYFYDIYRISSNKRPRRLLNFETVRCGAYFKVSKMNNIEGQNLVIFSLKIRMKHFHYQ